MVRYFKGISSIYILILLLSSCYTKPDRIEPIHKKKKGEVRVVTYNINWGDKNFSITEPQKTLDAIKYIDGDIVLLQEVTPYWNYYLKAQLSEVYPYLLFKTDGKAGGLAVLSKYPVSGQQYIKSPIGWHNGWIMNVNSPWGVLQVANLHLTPPLINKANPSFSLSAYFSTPMIRKKEITNYYRFLKKSYPSIIAGDFNEDNNGFVTQFLNEHGYTDAKNRQSLFEFTWQWNLGLITLKRKLDHVFYNQSFIEKKAQSIRYGDSDHLPLVVDLKRKQGVQVF